MPEPPKSDEYAHSNWLYGYDKRAAEDVFSRAVAERKFPFTSLRLPMVNSKRDHYDRIYGYMLRLQDDGPILIPQVGNQPVRHVYGDDVVQAIVRVSALEASKSRAFNIGQDETLSLEQFLEMLAKLMHKPLKTVRVPRQELEHEGLLPNCSPFSGKWMSSLDNSLSKTELGISYTAMPAYLEKLIDYFQTTAPRSVEGYLQRRKELELARSR
jgi:nucleoside-diphosphate-sugar epimerase